MRSPLAGNPPISCDSTCHGYAATDWAVKVGTPVYATHSGTFYQRGPYPNLGKMDPGLTGDVEGGDVFSRVAHLSSRVVASGTHVSEGQLIGYSGNTGYSLGPHLHGYFIIGGTRWGIADYLNSIGYQWSGADPTPITIDPITEDDMPGYNLLYGPDPDWGFYVEPGSHAVKMPRAKWNVLTDTNFRVGKQEPGLVVVIGDPDYWGLWWATRAPGIPVPGQDGNPLFTFAPSAFTDEQIAALSDRLAKNLAVLDNAEHAEIMQKQAQLFEAIEAIKSEDAEAIAAAVKATLPSAVVDLLKERL